MSLSHASPGECSLRYAQLRLQALSDSFILNIMRSLYQPAVENIDLCAEKDLDVRSVGSPTARRACQTS